MNNTQACRANARPGSMLIEATVALAILAIVAAIVAQTIVWGMQERVRARAHQAAVELAANVLEAARATPFEKLDQAWAERQHVPSEMAELLPEGKVVARVGADLPVKGSKRVTVEVRWLLMPDHPPLSVQMTTVLSPRQAKKPGGTP